MTDQILASFGEGKAMAGDRAKLEAAFLASVNSGGNYQLWLALLTGFEVGKRDARSGPFKAMREALEELVPNRSSGSRITL